MQKSIALDVDGVILNTLACLRLELLKNGYTFYPEKVTDYDFNCDMGCDRDVVFDYLKNVETFKHRAVYDGVPVAISYLKKKGFDLIGWTSMDVKYTALVSERVSFMNTFGITCHISPTNTEKSFNAVKDTIAVFEDSPKSVEHLLNNGYAGRIYLVNHPYNQDVVCDGEKVIRVRDLFEGVSILCSELGGVSVGS